MNIWISKFINHSKAEIGEVIRRHRARHTQVSKKVLG